MRHSLRLDSLVATLVLLAGVASADDAPSPKLGTRLRVTTTGSPEPVVGTLARIDDQALGLTAPGRSEAIVMARRDILRLERHVPSQRGKGALIGFGIGFAAGFGLVALGCRECVDPWGHIYGAVGGVAVGGCGAVVSGARWAEVPLGEIRSGDGSEGKSGVRVRVVPVVGHRRRGVSVAVSFR